MYCSLLPPPPPPHSHATFCGSWHTSLCYTHTFEFIRLESERSEPHRRENKTSKNTLCYLVSADVFAHTNVNVIFVVCDRSNRLVTFSFFMSLNSTLFLYSLPHSLHSTAKIKISIELGGKRRWTKSHSLPPPMTFQVQYTFPRDTAAGGKMPTAKKKKENK